MPEDPKQTSERLWPTPVIAPFGPTQYASEAEEAKAKRSGPSLWDAVSDTTLSADAGRWLGKVIEGTGPSSASWVTDNEAEVSRILATTPFEYHDDILSSGSITEALFEKATIDEKTRNMRRIAQSGAYGIAAVLGINLVEGAALAYATYGTTAPLILGHGYRGFRTAQQTFNVFRVAKAGQRAAAARAIAANASRVGLFARGAAAGSAEALAYTTVDSFLDPTVEGHDFRTAALFGGLLGGAFTGLAGRSMLAAELTNAGRRMELDLLHRGFHLPPRFHADDLARRMATASGMSVEEAAAVISLGDAVGLDFTHKLAVGGRKARGTVVKTERFTRKGQTVGAVEFLDDGKAILRAFFNDDADPEVALRGLAAMLRNRLFNPDLPETQRGGLTDNEVNIIEDWLGVGLRAARTAPGLVEGNFEAGLRRGAVGTRAAPGRMTRAVPWNKADERKFANGFFRWMMTGDRTDIPEHVIPVFEKVRSILARTFDGMNDPRLLMGRKPNRRVQNVFDKVLAHEINQQRLGELQYVNDLLRLASGPHLEADDPTSIPDVAATGTSATWSEVPSISKRTGIGASLLNQSVRAMTSTSGVVRWLAYNMHFTRVAPRDASGRLIAQPTTINEMVHRIKAISEARFLKAYSRNFTEYAAGGEEYVKVGAASRLRNKFQHARKDEFNRKVYEEIHAPGTHQDKNVKAVAEAARHEFRVLADAAKKAKVVGFVDLPENANYFPRLYRWSAIDAFVMKNGQAELKRVLLHSLDKSELDATEADALATLLAERLIKLARGERKDSVFNLDSEVLAVLHEMKKPSDPSGVILTPRARGRFKADPMLRLPDGSRAALSDFVETDIPMAMGAYTRSMAGAIGETKLIARFKGEVLARDGEKAADKINSWDDIVEYVREKNRTTMTGDDLESEIGSLRELRANMRSEPDPANFAGDNTLSVIFSENARRLMKLSYLENGAYFALAQINEISRTIARAGFRAVITQLPVVKELIQSARRGEPVNEVTHLLEQTFGLASDRIRRTTGRIDDALNQYPPEVRAGWYRRFAVKMAKVDANLNAAVFAFADVSGLAPITSATQHLTAMSVIQRLHLIGTKGKSHFADTLIAQWGISKEQYAAIVKAVSKHAEVNKHGRVVNLKEAEWDADVFRSFLTFVERAVITTIQDPPVRGDFHRFFFTPIGKLLIQFRTFNLKGIDSFLRTSLQRRDATVVKEYLLTGIMAMMSQTARKQLDLAAISDPEKRKKFEEENFSDEAFAAMFASGPTENFLLIGATDALSNLAFGESTFGSRIRYTGLSSNPLDLSATPAWAVVDRAYKAARGPIRAMMSKDYDYSQKDLHSLRMSIPMGRFYGIGQALSALEERLGRDLPEESRNTSNSK